jgi:GT2 family glycosyltransferase
VPADPPLVSFVLVNWHTERYLPAALDSIRAQTHPNIEIVLVDNASPEFDAALLAPYQPVVLLQNSRNMGFAAANNQGIAASTGAFVFPLNCDAWISPDFVETALAVFASNPRIGTVVPKLVRDDGSGRLESTGHVLYTDRTPAQRGADEQDQEQYDRGGFVFGGSAAAIGYRRAMLDDIAEGQHAGRPEVFDESFFAYYEDVDLDWRAQLAGWHAYYQPQCVAWHRAHGSGGRRRWRIRLRAEKNRYLMLLKNDTLRGLLGELGSLSIYEGFHFLRWLLSPALWPAPLLFLAEMPRALGKRWRNRARRRANWRSVQRQLLPRGVPLPPKAETPAAEPLGISCLYPPLISVVVLNYNGADMTRDCLASLYSQTWPHIETILVDNGSDLEDVDALIEEYSDVLRLPRNLGFAGGVNWGVSQATGHYIALVNNDCILRPECLERLYHSLQRSEAAAVSGRLVNVASEEQALALSEMEAETLATLGHGSPLLAAWKESGRNHGVSLYGYPVTNMYRARPASFYPSGGLCLLERSAVEELLPELLPQLYFAYYEDVALGIELRRRSRRVGKEPGAIAAHVESSTARRLGSLRLRFLQERNRWLNILGYYPASVIWRLLPALLVQTAIFDLASLAQGLGPFIGSAGAKLWLLCHPFVVARHRRRGRAAAAVSDRDWLQELSGQVRGRPHLLNRLSLAWCRLVGIPCYELARQD